MAEGTSSSALDSLKQLKKVLHDFKETDAVLLKFLRANNFNVQKTELLLREKLYMRAVHFADTYADHGVKPEVMEKYEFVSPLGVAKDGTPLTYIAFGSGDLHGAVSSMSSYEIIRYCTLLIEKELKRTREQSMKLGREINEITYIVDMDKFSLKHGAYTAVIDTGLDLFNLLQVYFPEIWKHILVVNAPLYFYHAFNIFRPIIRRTFLQKIRVASPEHSRDLLLKYVDENELPAFLGGTRTDSNGNPRCEEFLKFGGDIPERYYTRNRLPPLVGAEGATSVVIGRNQVLNVPLVVRRANSLIHTELQSEGGSVPTAIFFSPHIGDSVPASDEHLDMDKWRLVSPYAKVTCHVSAVDAYSACPWPGTYVFRFDNFCNWISTRKLIYRLTVIPPTS